MEWISVKDRLPTVKDQLLIYDSENDEIVIGVFLYSTESIIAFGIFGRGQVFDITHWMPLPEPPKQ